ncbi:hypothetical protein XELAEV_18031879mg [Xenopus laevis]|uniref:Uncharacterized protein n=1 Tax=Xenopus laevis TaxID=8355 RepID=A0A974CP44_XENLA|nr:hypothetical protein XELAEV_18031879mg [Xenopus laevis]
MCLWLFKGRECIARAACKEHMAPTCSRQALVLPLAQCVASGHRCWLHELKGKAFAIALTATLYTQLRLLSVCGHIQSCINSQEKWFLCLDTNNDFG